jgi:hypothetical protein
MGGLWSKAGGVVDRALFGIDLAARFVKYSSKIHPSFRDLVRDLFYSKNFSSIKS